MKAPLSATFPELNSGNHTVTSPEDCAYNCVAWAAGETGVWWDHLFGYWPSGARRDGSVTAYVDMFVSLGFEPCATPEHERGFEKISVYGDGGQFTHVARQLPSGLWTSKLGSLEDIEHRDPACISSPAYGQPVRFLRRRR